ncbi:MAG: bacteriocin-protection protein, partial [Opitutaceae bacterium]
MKPTFFPTSAAFRLWLEQNHATVGELRIGFYKKASGKIAMTYQEAVLESLCFGWIDGIVNRLDAESYMHRFTRRKPASTWSNINVAHVARLSAAGKMHPAGLAAFQARSTAKTGIYSFERKTPPQLAPAAEKAFRSNRKAWEFFQAQPPWYRRT